MPSKKGPRVWVPLKCTNQRARWVKTKSITGEKVTVSQVKECNTQNYVTEKNKRNTEDKIEMNKFCSTCKKQTLHKETKLS